MNRWIELSLHHSIPSSLLILSRAMLQEQRASGAAAAAEAGLQQVIATMPDTIVKELSSEAAAGWTLPATASSSFKSRLLLLLLLLPSTHAHQPSTPTSTPTPSSCSASNFKTN